MTTWHGKNGVVKAADTDVVAETTSFTVEESVDTQETSAQGRTWRSRRRGQRSWTASIECHLDVSDTNGQEVFLVGQRVTVGLYPGGDEDEAPKRTGSAIVTARSEPSELEGIVSLSITLEGTGELAKAIVLGAIVGIDGVTDPVHLLDANDPAITLADGATIGPSPSSTGQQNIPCTIGSDFIVSQATVSYVEDGQKKYFNTDSAKIDHVDLGLSNDVLSTPFTLLFRGSFAVDDVNGFASARDGRIGFWDESGDPDSWLMLGGGEVVYTADNGSYAREIDAGGDLLTYPNDVFIRNNGDGTMEAFFNGTKYTKTLSQTPVLKSFWNIYFNYGTYYADSNHVLVNAAAVYDYALTDSQIASVRAALSARP